MKPILITAFTFFLSLISVANSYNEPWHEAILKKSESFVLLKINSIDENNGVKATLIKIIAGKEIPQEITIDNFFMIDTTSYSYEPFLFRLPDMDTAYFFLIKGENNNYQMPTPTSGFAWRRGNGISSTYRISMHKAFASVQDYEKTMAELFNFNHGIDIDKEFIKNYAKQYLSQKPGDPTSSDEKIRNLFFNQHIALESLYYIADSSDFELIIPFIRSTQIHNQIGAIRALSAINTKKSKDELIIFLKAETNYDLSKVMAVWALKRLNARDCIKELKKIQKNASTKPVSYGLDIMDIRIGTHIDSDVKSSILNLINNLK